MQSTEDFETIAWSVVNRRRDMLGSSPDRHQREFAALLKKRRKWHEERVTSLAEDEADHILAELAWLSTLSRNAKGYFGGMAAMSRAFKRVQVGNASYASPWPTPRSYYLHADLVAAQPALMQRLAQLDSVMPQELADFRPIDMPAPLLPEPDTRDAMVRINMGDKEVAAFDQSDGFVQPLYRLLGTRMSVVSDEGLYCLLLQPEGEARDQLAALMQRLRMPIENPEAMALVVISHVVDARTSIGFAAWERGRPEETAIGSSALGVDSMVWNDPEYALIQAYLGTLVEDLGRTMVRISLLPHYFDFQIEQVVTEGPRRYRSDGGEKAKPGGRRPYKLVRAIRKVRADRWPVPAASDVDPSTRREPETQVEVAGFWRRLAPTSVGKRPDGAPVMGRTWVTAHTRWRDKPAGESLPRLKEPVMPYIEAETSASDPE